LNFDFEFFLDSLMGPRELFHIMECQVCGFDEIYFQHPFSKKQIGVACEGCNFVYVLNSEQVYSLSKTVIQNQKHLQSGPLVCDYDKA
jgi:hypothetical protein